MSLMHSCNEALPCYINRKPILKRFYNNWEPKLEIIMLQPDSVSLSVVTDLLQIDFKCWDLHTSKVARFIEPNHQGGLFVFFFFSDSIVPILRLRILALCLLLEYGMVLSSYPKSCNWCLRLSKHPSYFLAGYRALLHFTLWMCCIRIVLSINMTWKLFWAVAHWCLVPSIFLVLALGSHWNCSKGAVLLSTYPPQPSWVSQWHYFYGEVWHYVLGNSIWRYSLMEKA